MRHPCFDFVFIGEAEVSLAQFLQGAPLETIDGIAYRTTRGRADP